MIILPEERENIKRYWEQPTGYYNAPAGMIPLAQKHINDLCSAIEHLENIIRNAEYTDVYEQFMVFSQAGLSVT